MDAGSLGSAVDGGLLPHCSTVVPTGPVIADFRALNNQAFGALGVDPVVGTTFVAPGTLLEDFSNGDWHLTGLVAGPTSFGLTWKCPGVVDGVCTLNLLSYAGLQFSVSGNIGPSGILHVTAGSVPDESPTAGLGCGRCNELGATEEVCRAPFANVTPGSVVSPVQTWIVTWNIFQSGSPIGTPDPYGVTTISWTLPAAADGGSYAVDFTLDDIRLIPIPH